MTFVGDWVFKQGGKDGIAGKAGKRTIFRRWAGIDGKSYKFFHRRLENTGFFNRRSITTTVANVAFCNI